MKRKQACLLSFILAHFDSLSESAVVCVRLPAVCLAGLWPIPLCPLWLERASASGREKNVFSFDHVDPVDPV